MTKVCMFTQHSCNCSEAKGCYRHLIGPTLEKSSARSWDLQGRHSAHAEKKLNSWNMLKQIAAWYFFRGGWPQTKLPSSISSSLEEPRVVFNSVFTRLKEARWGLECLVACEGCSRTCSKIWKAHFLTNKSFTAKYIPWVIYGWNSPRDGGV